MDNIDNTEVEEIEYEIMLMLNNSFSYNLHFQQLVLKILKRSKFCMKKNIFKQLLLLIIVVAFTIGVGLLTIYSFEFFNIGTLFLILSVLLLIINIINIIKKIIEISKGKKIYKRFINIIEAVQSGDLRYENEFTEIFNEYYNVLFISFIESNEDIKKETATSHFLIYLNSLSERNMCHYLI